MPNKYNCNGSYNTYRNAAELHHPSNHIAGQVLRRQAMTGQYCVGLAERDCNKKDCEFAPELFVAVHIRLKTLYQNMIYISVKFVGQFWDVVGLRF